MLLDETIVAFDAGEYFYCFLDFMVFHIENQPVYDNVHLTSFVVIEVTRVHFLKVDFFCAFRVNLTVFHVFGDCAKDFDVFV